MTACHFIQNKITQGSSAGIHVLQKVDHKVISNSQYQEKDEHLLVCILNLERAEKLEGSIIQFIIPPINSIVLVTVTYIVISSSCKKYSM